MSLHTLAILKDIPTSPTISIMKLATKLKSEGQTLYDFGVGEMNPAIPLPQVFACSLISAVKDQKTHYIDNQGYAPLRQALSDDLQQNFQLTYPQSCISVHPGPRAALATAIQAVLDPTNKRNRALAFLPVYEAFNTAPQLLTGFPAIPIRTDKNCLPDLDHFKEVLSSRDDIGVVFLNSPNNPTGVVYSEELLQKIVEILKPYPYIAVISDEVYRTIHYTGYKYSSIAKFLPKQSIVVGGISKEISGTGIRLGFVAGPPEVIQATSSLTALMLSTTNLPIQVAFTEFLLTDKNAEIRAGICSQLESKMKLLRELFRTLPGFSRVEIVEPQGAFYFFPNIEKYLGCRVGSLNENKELQKKNDDKKISDDEELALYILEEAKVVCIPGSKFGKPGYLRFAFASIPTEYVTPGLQRLSDALLRLY